MSVSRVSAFGALALTGVLALSACATENPAPSDGNTAAGDPTNAAAVADCFTGDLKAEGSSAQKNAIDEAISAYQTACTDATIDYQPTGSGAGIKPFTQNSREPGDIIVGVWVGNDDHSPMRGVTVRITPASRYSTAIERANMWQAPFDVL